MTYHARPKSLAENSNPIGSRSPALGQSAESPVNPGRWLIVLCAVLIGATIGGTALLLSYSRERALADSERELKNTALILAQQANETFQAIELVQQSVVAHVRALGITSGEELVAQMSTRGVHDMLRDKIVGLPFVDNLTVMTTGGVLVNFAQAWPIPALDISDRPHFQAATKSAGTYLSAPVKSRTAGVWTIFLIQPLTAANGKLVGYVMGAVTVEYFEKFFASIALSDTSAISLARHDGVLLVRFPRVEPAIGQDLSQRANWGPLMQTPAASSRAVSGVDGRERLFAAHTLDKFPVSAVVTVTAESVLVDWNLVAAFAAAAAALVSVALATIFWFILREFRRRQASTQRQIASQQLHLDTALNNMSQGLCMFDADANLVLCNERYVEMYGHSRDIVIPGASLRSILADRRKRGHLTVDVDEFIRGLREGLTKAATYVHILASGDGRTISIVSRPMPDGGWVATHEDITERRNAELERDRNRDFLDGILENVPVSIYVRNASDRRLVLINRAGERLLGMSRNDVLGRAVHQVLDKATADAIAEQEEALFGSTTGLRFDEYPAKDPLSGEGRYLTASGSCIRSADGTPQFLLSVVEDVTERRTVRQQLQQAQRMEAVARLTGGLAHDFNNLLMVIIGNLDLLAEEVAGIPSAAEKVETILQASLRGSDLTGRLLAFSRRQSLMPKRLQPNGLIRNLTALLQRTLGGEITIELALCDALWPVTADESQLEAALLNLAINARDAMPGGGKLAIATRNVTLDAAYCAGLPDLKAGEFAAIEVTDTGTGMPPEILARVFEPFFTTKTPDRGTGLGLSSVFGFIRQSGGHIDVRSEVGTGTMFVLYLPRDEALPALADPLPTAAAKAGARSSKKTILVVEDDPAIRAMVAARLGALGYGVEVAEHAAEALEKLETHRVDLLFTDMVMPGKMNGKQLAIAARAKYPGLRTLFTSGFPGESELADAKLEPGDMLLTKPYRNDDLTAAIHRALDGQPA